MQDTVQNALRHLRRKGMWDMTKQDLVDALRGHPRANDAIFWFCQAWHSGDDDLYKIMCAMDYTPRPWSDNPMVKDPSTGKLISNPKYDPDLVELLNVLAARFESIVEPPLLSVMLRDVREGQVLTADGGFPCILANWPCRVYRHHGALGVQCSGGVHGIRLLPGSEVTFHPLTEDERGYVVGFKR